MSSEVVLIDAEIKGKLNLHRFKVMAELGREVTLKELLTAIVEVYLENEMFQKYTIKHLRA